MATTALIAAVLGRLRIAPAVRAPPPHRPPGPTLAESQCLCGRSGLGGRVAARPNTTRRPSGSSAARRATRAASRPRPRSAAPGQAESQGHKVNNAHRRCVTIHRFVARSSAMLRLVGSSIRRAGWDARMTREIGWRSLNLFISSTFSDMHAMRDYLPTANRVSRAGAAAARDASTCRWWTCRWAWTPSRWMRNRNVRARCYPKLQIEEGVFADTGMPRAHRVKPRTRLSYSSISSAIPTRPASMRRRGS